MKNIFSALITIILLLLPTSVLASSCSSNGATIVYVNGIETTQQEADHDTALLEQKFLQYGGSSDIQIITGYNPSHLDGAGDLLESITQAFDVPISDYDLDTILDQTEPEVTTRKLLLVGHSQGTFYTNEMYDYLVRNGVPPQSIAVYNLATPADQVEGGGTYLTSANDKVINYVREIDAEWNAPRALAANIIIPPESGYADNAWGGHLPDVYLGGAPQRVVSDIQNALAKLSAPSATAESCFMPPSQGLSYDAQKALFSVADPAVANIDLAAFEAKTTVASVMENTNDIINTALSDAYFSVVPRPTVQNAAGVFAVEKALYGSSLSVADYEALAEGKDIPEVAIPVQPQPQPQPVETPKLPQDTPVQQVENAQPPDPPRADPAAALLAPVPISPGFGGGASPVVTNTETVSSDQVASSSQQDQPSDPVVIATSTDQSASSSEPVATTTLPFSILSPADGTTFSTTSVAFSGTTSPGAFVLANFGTTTASTSADASGDWSFAFELPESTTSISLNAADNSGDYSSTAMLTIGVALPQPAKLPPAIVVTCPDFEGNGYFFDPSYMQFEYVDGLLRIHLRLLTPYNDGRPFHAKAIVNGTDCISLSPNFGGGISQTWLPAHLQYYSFRMSSPTHWILWDDEDDVQATCDVCEGDIPTGVASVSFAAMIDSGASNLTTFPYPPTWP